MNDNNDIIKITDTENVEVVEAEAVDTVPGEFLNEETANTFKLLNLKSKMADLQSVVDNINDQQKSVLGESEEFDPIDEMLKGYTEEELKAMTYEEINNILVDENGEPIEFAIDFDGDEKKLNEFKKDFIILRKQALTTFESFDTEIANINKEIAESQEEFDKAVAEFGNVSNLIRRRLEKGLEEADDNKKPLYEKMLYGFNCGLSLDNLKTYCKGYKGRDILTSFKDEKKTHYTYKKYLKVIESLNIKTDLTKFSGLEPRFIPEYAHRNNLFVYSAIHFIASWHNKDYTKADGLFITQFTINLKNLFYDKFDSVEDKETFLNNIRDILMIIG